MPRPNLILGANPLIQILVLDLVKHRREALLYVRRGKAQGQGKHHPMYFHEEHQGLNEGVCPEGQVGSGQTPLMGQTPFMRTSE